MGVVMKAWAAAYDEVGQKGDEEAFRAELPWGVIQDNNECYSFTQNAAWSFLDSE